MGPGIVAIASPKALALVCSAGGKSLRIRCERCATVYELDEKRLPAAGAPVKCTRCQEVFWATPPASEAPRTASSEEGTAVFGFSNGAPPEQTASFASAPAPAPAARARSRTPAGPATSPRPASPARWPWVVLALVLVAAALAALWFTWSRPDTATAARLVALEDLAARDDRASLEMAASRASSDPSGEARALRAMALLWLAADARDDLAPLLARVGVLQAQLVREDRARSSGWQQRSEEIASRLEQALRESAVVQERERVCLEEASAAEAAARSAGTAGMPILRTQAIRQALDGDGALPNTVRDASALDASDPWVEMALGLAAAVRGDLDVQGLFSVSARQPRFLRARVLLARAFHAAGRDGEAVRILDGVLAENGEHEIAKARKAEILSPPHASVSRVDLTGVAPLELPAGHLPRLKPRS